MKSTSNSAALITEITVAFQDEPYPGDESIVSDNADLYPECVKTRATFAALRWQEVAEEVLSAERTALSFMSKMGFKYYLPAFMCSLLRNGSVGDNGVGMVVRLLKLPTETEPAIAAEQVQQFGIASQLPDADLEKLEDELQNQLAQTNTRINIFFSRTSLFTQAQAQSICHFLVYIRDEFGNDILSHEAALAIQRYWFQFD